MKNQIYFYILVATAGSCLTAGPAKADQFTLPEEIGRIEAPRDMNLLQVEPTVINERYYTSGRSERHQFVGNVLPYGSPIPDNDAPVTTAVVKHRPADQQAPSSTTAPAKSLPLQK